MLHSLSWASQFIAGVTLVQTPASPPFETDRPDFTESSLTVPKGMLQVESGATLMHPERGIDSFSGPELLMRIGVADRFEVRLGFPNYVWQRAAGERTEGFDDTYLGAKIQLGPLPCGTGLALIPGIFLPTGKSGLRREAAEPNLQVVWSRDLGGGRRLAGMVQIASEKVDGRRQTPVMHTVALALPIGERFGAFLEHVLEVRRGVHPVQIAHGGFTYAPSETTQWDFHVGVGLTRVAPDLFLGLGYSVRF